MSKLSNLIQRREFEPLLHKADKIAKHYEKVANCPVSVLQPECSVNLRELNFTCKHCKGEIDANGNRICALMHLEAIKYAKKARGSYIYACKEGLVFWASPFYSGERYAGALISGGIQNTINNNEKIKALANMLLICAAQISGMSFVQKNIAAVLEPENRQSSDQVQNSNNDLLKEDEKIEAVRMDMERMLMANLRRGDISEARNLLFKLLNARYSEVKANISAFRLKALELLVLLTRSTTNPNDINDSKILEANSRYQKKINESTSLEEIEAILAEIAEKMAERIFSFHGVRHFPALRKAERYIWDNYTKKISLREIARASGLSAPYFSTIFKEEMGENLSDYLNRLRVEKASALLLTTNMSIGEIAKTCGFEDQSWFSKIFKNNTGYTPGKYRDQGSILGLSA